LIDLKITDPLILPLVPVPARPAVLALWRLDARLAEVAIAGREATLRQIRMRWWAQAIASLTTDGAPAGEPLVGALADAAPDIVSDPRLSDWTDAWEAMTIDPGCVDSARQRGHAVFALTATLLGMTSARPTAGAIWSLVDRSQAQVDVTARGGLLLAASAEPRPARSARPLAALEAVAWMRAHHDGAVRWRREQLAVLRAGLLGW
jgi:15-cis-phytoene synthase